MSMDETLVSLWYHSLNQNLLSHYSKELSHVQTYINTQPGIHIGFYLRGGNPGFGSC